MARPGVGPSLFDGSMVEVYDRELTARLRQILHRVLDRKARGQGALARPEANIGIVKMLCILHQLEGGTRWIEEAATTYIRTLDWALRNSADVCWRFEWLSPVHGDPLFDDVFDTLYDTAVETSTLLSTYRAAVGD